MLRRRIHRQAAHHRDAQQTMTPMQGAHPDPTSAGRVPAVMPTALIGYVPNAVGGYGTLTMEEADVLWGADGAPYLATDKTGPSWDAAGGWGTVVAAGNPREGAASETRARAQHTPLAYAAYSTGAPMYAADGAPYGTGQPIYRGPGR